MGEGKTQPPGNKTAGQSDGRPLIPQPHGGALRTGGVSGNRGGGRPPSVIREALRASFDKRRRLLDRIADGKLPGTTAADQLRAIDLIGKYSMDSRTGQVDIDQVRDCLSRTLDVIRRLLSPEDAKRLVDEIRPIWKTP